MFPTRRIHRAALVYGLACAMLASAMSGAAAAQDLRSPDSRSAAAPRPQDVRSPDSRDAAPGVEISAQPMALPQSPAPSDDTRWLPIALSIVATLVIVAGSAARLRRVRIRRHRAVRATT